MATIQNTMTMADQVTPAFNRMLAVMQKTLNTMNTLQESFTRGFNNSAIPRNTRNIQKMNGDVNATGESTERVTKELAKAIRNSQRMNNVVRATVRSNQSSERSTQRISQNTSQGARNTERMSTSSTGASRGFDTVARSTERVRNNTNSTNSSIRRLNNSLGSLNLMNVYSAVQLFSMMAEKVKQVIAFLDDLSLTTARLNNINDGLQTTAELNDKIFHAANRARAGYQNMAKDVAKLNLLAKDQFKSNDEAIAFVETLYKIGAVSGTGTQEMSAAVYQLNQAMAAGKLQGDEFRSVMENLPMLADGIALYTGKTKADLKEMSSDGVITADIVKNSVFTMMTDVNKTFQEMPKTFGQMMNIVKNHATKSLNDVQKTFSDFVNSTKGQAIFNDIMNSMDSLAQVGLMCMNGLINAVNFMKDNWGTIFPVLIGFLSVLTTKALIAGVTMLSAFTMANLPLIALALGIAFIIMILNQLGLSFAQIGFLIGEALKWICELLYQLLPILIAVGLAMLIYWVGTLVLKLAMLPLVIANVWSLAAAWLAVNWPVLLVVLAIAALILVMGYLGITVGDVIGFIVGCWYGLLAVINNVCVFIYNIIMEISTFIANAFNNAGNIAKRSMLGFCEGFLLGIQTVMKALEELINMIPFVEVQMTSGIDRWLSEVQAAKAEVDGEIAGNWAEAPKAEYKSISGEYKKGKQKGLDFTTSMKSMLSKIGGGKTSKAPSAGVGGLKIPAIPGITPGSLDKKKGDGKVKGGKLDEVGKINDDVTITDEDIKMLKDIATTDFINSYTTLQPNMQVQFTGPINETADVNKILNAIETMAEEALSNIIVEEVR